MKSENESWYRCPRCGKKLLKLGPASVMYGVPIWCGRCKDASQPAIFGGRVVTGGLPMYGETE